MPATGTTHICLVLDRSGSMQAVHADALGSVNTYIMTAKRDRALYEARFSMIAFSSESVDTIRQNEIMEEVKPIGSEDYVCTGLTPLFDAVGRGVGILDRALGDKQGKAILVIMTDGQENASREFNHAMITDLLKRRQEAGWLVVFLGEGLDVAKQGVAMGAMAANVAAYSGGEGLRAAGRVAARSTISYAISAGDLWKARDEAAFTAEERDELAGKKNKNKK
jgi:Mg-chelatase subunit ChlD